MAGGEKCNRQLRSGAAAQKQKTPNEGATIQKEQKSPAKQKTHQNQESKTNSKTPQKEMSPKTPGKKQDPRSGTPSKKLKKGRYFESNDEETTEPSASNVSNSLPKASGKHRTRDVSNGRAGDGQMEDSVNVTGGGNGNPNQGHRNYARPRGRGHRHSGFKFGPRSYGQPMMMPMYPYGPYGYPAYPPPMMYGHGPHGRHQQMMHGYHPMPPGPWGFNGMTNFPPPPPGGYGVQIKRGGSGSRGYHQHHHHGDGYSDDYYPRPVDDFPDLDDPPQRNSAPPRARTLTEVLDDITRPPPQLPGSKVQQAMEDPRMRSGHYREAIRKSMTNAPESFTDAMAANTAIVETSLGEQLTPVSSASEPECEIIDLETEADTVAGMQEKESIVPNPVFQLPNKPENFEPRRKRPSKRPRCPSPSMMDEEVFSEAPAKKHVNEVSLTNLVSIVSNDEFLIELGRVPPSSSTKEKDIAGNEVITLDSDEEVTVVSVSAPDLLRWEIDLSPSVDVELNSNPDEVVSPRTALDVKPSIDEKHVIVENEVEYVSQIGKPLPPLSNFAEGMIQNDPEPTVHLEEGSFAKFRTVLKRLFGRFQG